MDFVHFIPSLLKRCNDEGVKITREGLYYTGQKNKFFVKSDDGKIILDESRFEEWLTERKSEIPEGFVRVAELSAGYGVCKLTCYRLIEKNNISLIKRKGVIYAKEDEFKDAFRRSGFSNKIQRI